MCGVGLGYNLRPVKKSDRAWDEIFDLKPKKISPNLFLLILLTQSNLIQKLCKKKIQLTWPGPPRQVRNEKKYVLFDPLRTKAGPSHDQI